MRRREFIALLGGAAAAWPLVARAQQPAVPVIGLLTVVSLNATRNSRRVPSRPRASLAMSRAETCRSNIGRQSSTTSVFRRWLRTSSGRASALIVAASGVPAVLAAKAATATIPLYSSCRPTRCKLA